MVDAGHRTSRFGLAVLLSIGIVVCTGVTVAAAAEEPALFDDRLQLVADRVPEFGGMFIDEDQRTLVVNVTERRPRTISDLRHALREVFPDENLPSRIRLQEVAFEFSRLKRWRDSALGVHAIGGVVSTDIDEAAGRLLIGVTDDALRGDVAQKLGAQGIPPEAWEVETTEVPTPMTSLTTRHRPVVGGLGIQRVAGSTCTLGFSAILRTPFGSTVPGFVTNSHCTSRSFEFDGSLFYQPTAPFSGNFIGNEEIDVTPFVGGSCPPQCARPGFPPTSCKCRLADSAFVASFADRISLSIASITENQQGPQFAYNGVNLPVVARGTPVVGQELRKVGIATGHNRGTVRATCVDIVSRDSDGKPVIVKCQTTTFISIAAGDSGSPVWQFEPCPSDVRATSCARLYGIAWTEFRTPTATGSIGGLAFSPIGNVTFELAFYFSGSQTTVCIHGRC